MTKFIDIRFKSLLRRLVIGEHYDFFQNGIINSMLTVPGSLPMLGDMFNVLQNVFVREDEFYKQSQAAMQTPEILFLHEKRIALFHHFWSIVQVIAKYYNDAAMVQAAKKLLFLKNNYKRIPQAYYQEASGIITNFVDDCLKADWKPSIEALNLLDIVTMEQETNENFKALYAERSQDKEDIAEIGKLSEIRADVDSAFEAFIETVNVAWRTNEMGAKNQTVHDGLVKVRRDINAAIHQAESNLARRGHHKTKEDDKTDEGTQAPDTTNPPATPTTPQNPDTTLPAAPDIPDQPPVAVPPGINPDDLNPPAAGE